MSSTTSPRQPDLRARSRDSSARSQVYRLLLGDIEQCAAKPGQSISEKDVSVALGVSRTPVREAFLQLAEEGLIVIAPQRGTTIAKISGQAVHEAQFAREVLERSIFAVACHAVGGDEGKTAALQKHLDTQRSAIARQDLSAFYESDGEFHRELARLSGFDGAGRIAGGARVHLNRVRWLGLPENQNPEAAFAEHEKIAAALAAGDAAGGDAVLRTHLRGVLATLPVVRGLFPDYFENDDAAQPTLPDTGGLTIGWNED